MKTNINFSIKELYLCLSIAFIFFSIDLRAQKSPNELSRISHEDFIKKITESKDSIIYIEDAFVFLSEKDTSYAYNKIDNKFTFSAQDSLIVSSQLRLKNVHFQHLYEDEGNGLHHIRFKEPVVIENSTSLVLSNCVFEKGYYLDINIPLNSYVDYFEMTYEVYGADITINESIIKGDFYVDIGTIDTYSSIFFTLLSSHLYSDLSNETTVFTNNIRSFDVAFNEFHGNNLTSFYIDKTREVFFEYNSFENANVVLNHAGISSESVIDFSDNNFKKYVLLFVEDFAKSDVYDWRDWKDKVISNRGFSEFLRHVDDDLVQNSAKTDSLIVAYDRIEKYKLEQAYKFEKRLFGGFYNLYTQQYDTDFANIVYVSLKNLDTERYNQLYLINPSFKNFFKWKINQFLKVFSLYGTSPSRTVIISVWIVFIFAFIYLFFPNSWDTINRNRLIKRLEFYSRYFRSKKSMKDLYDDNRSKDLMTFEDFKTYLGQSKKEIPSYFILLAKPIFYFAGANYKIVSRVLSKMDVLKGRWVELPKRKKIVSSIVIGFWLFFLLLFDLFIKFLNALTLSLNTFTTLGFGEIPTTGIPRYLAIIQGFIGWFMLSIFSVSLISQVLN